MERDQDRHYVWMAKIIEAREERPACEPAAPAQLGSFSRPRGMPTPGRVTRLSPRLAWRHVESQGPHRRPHPSPETIVASERMAARGAARVGRRHRVHGQPDDRSGRVGCASRERPSGGRRGAGRRRDVHGRGRVRVGELPAGRRASRHRPEKQELAQDPQAELNELALIYVKRGLDADLALKVARQLSAYDRWAPTCATSWDSRRRARRVRCRPPRISARELRVVRARAHPGPPGRALRAAHRRDGAVVAREPRRARRPGRASGGSADGARRAACHVRWGPRHGGHRGDRAHLRRVRRLRRRPASSVVDRTMCGVGGTKLERASASFCAAPSIASGAARRATKSGAPTCTEYRRCP